MGDNSKSIYLNIACVLKIYFYVSCFDNRLYFPLKAILYQFDVSNC